MTAGPTIALRRELGVFGAVMMGLGSIIGTGVFVSIGIAAGIAGPSVVLAIVIAGALALCNALSSAQLAANCPTSGGTYEYGYVYLRPWLGFSAGWMFLCAKSASAATAALGFAAYLAAITGAPDGSWRTIIACAAVVVLVAVVLSGMRRSSALNIVIVSVTLLALGAFVAAGLKPAIEAGARNFAEFFAAPDGSSRHAVARLLEAAALMFVAFTGYGRIATMGEEVRQPRRTIPRAIVIALLAATALYIIIAAVGIGAAGAPALADTAGAGSAGSVSGGAGALGSGGLGGGGGGGGSGGGGHEAPLATVARTFGAPWVPAIVAAGAMTAMLGVLLNLVLGLSRVALAMGRRGDLPRGLAHIEAHRATPARAVLFVGAVIFALAAVGSIRLAWSFSAFTVLVYYAITNLAAIRLPRGQRLFHPLFTWLGLAGCLGLAFWVEWRVWAAGLAVLGLGLVGRAMLRGQSEADPRPT